MTGINVLLGELGAQHNVRGCALVTGDGITVHSELHGRFREDVVSGLISFLIQTTWRALDEQETAPELDRFVLHATHGKILVQAVGEAWLVAITDQFAHLDELHPVFDSVADRLFEASRMGG